jgi:hypothetical protein
LQNDKFRAHEDHEFALELRWACEEGGEEGKKMERKALELRKLQLDERLEEERRNELDRRERYLDFLASANMMLTVADSSWSWRSGLNWRRTSSSTSAIVIMKLIVTDIIVSSRRN